MKPNRMEMSAMIDHTLLKPTASGEDMVLLCREATEHSFAAVCVNSFYVPLACKLLNGSGVRVCAVAGFPLGADSTAVKAFAAADAVRSGAAEVDMVLNIGAMKEGRHHVVLEDIKAVVSAVKAVDLGTVVKVIIETCYLNEAEKITACRLARDAGAGFVKTSTGFGDGGATVADVALMRNTVGPEMGVKASGGIKTAAQALAMVAAGANRVGTSSGVAIVREMAR